MEIEDLSSVPPVNFFQPSLYFNVNLVRVSFSLFFQYSDLEFTVRDNKVAELEMVRF